MTIGLLVVSLWSEILPTLGANAEYSPVRVNVSVALQPGMPVVAKIPKVPDSNPSISGCMHGPGVGVNV